MCAVGGRFFGSIFSCGIKLLAQCPSVQRLVLLVWQSETDCIFSVARRGSCQADGSALSAAVIVQNDAQIAGI